MNNNLGIIVDSRQIPTCKLHTKQFVGLWVIIPFQCGLLYLVILSGKISKFTKLQLWNSANFLNTQHSWGNEDFTTQGRQHQPIKQFLLKCHQGCHRNYDITELETPPRHVRRDLCIYEGSTRNYVQDKIYINSCFERHS